MKNSIVRINNNIRRKIINYILTNNLFIFYVLFSFVATIIVRGNTLSTIFNLKPMLTDLGLILILGSFGYMVKTKNQFKYFFTLLIVICSVCIISSVYYHFFSSFPSIGEFATIGQTETVTGSIYDKIKIIDIIFVVFPILFYFIHKKLRYDEYYYLIEKTIRKIRTFIITFIIGIFSLSYSFAVANSTDFSRLSKQWNRLYIVERFGIIMYQINDLVQYTIPKINSMFGYENSLNMFNEYFSDQEKKPNNKYTGILKGKNVVFVHLESMQDYLMDLSFNGEEVAPNLKKLAQEGMFFENFYPQVSTGTSSDTEFTLLTGLLPAASGTVFVSYYDRNYFALPKFFSNEGYYTFSMHGNFSSMWNRNKTHPLLGYQGMFFEESFTYKPEDVINLGINDELFFEQAMPILENIEKENNNYMGTVITLSNHSPFKLASTYSTLDLSSHYVDELGIVHSKDYLSNLAVGEYIKSANYADKALGEFINYINESDYFNDTVFVFYGDHDAKLSRQEMNYLYNLNPQNGSLYREEDKEYTKYDYYDHELSKKTPLIIWTKNKKLKNTFKGTISYYTGMYNVAPTILNMMGLYNKYTVGGDIFTSKNDNLVVFPNGNILSQKLYYNNSADEYKLFVKEKDIVNSYLNELKSKKDIYYEEYLKSIGNTNDEIIKDYIKNLSIIADKRIEVSNSIIVYNLLDTVSMDGE